MFVFRTPVCRGTACVMGAVVLTAIAVWLVLSALTTVVWTLVARGGLREDRWRARMDAKPARLEPGRRRLAQRGRSVERSRPLGPEGGVPSG
jgi:hypothetical protein